MTARADNATIEKISAVLLEHWLSMGAVHFETLRVPCRHDWPTHAG
jgi:hypothetical protein